MSKKYCITDDLSGITVNDWIAGVGDVSTQYEVAFIRRFAEAIKSKPRPPCEECIYQARIDKERENTLNELIDIIRNTKKYGTIEPEELFHWTGIIAIIDSLRTGDDPK